jgi:hypothetical protein
MTAFADRALDAMGEAFRDRAGPLLPPIVEALTDPAADVDDLLAPTGPSDVPRWSDLDETPIPATLGAATGTRIPSGLTLEQQRTFLREQPARRRGSAASIAAAARAAAPGRRVDLFERQGGAYGLEVRLTGGTNDAATLAAVQAAVALQKPVGITLTVTFAPGATFNHVKTQHGPTLGQLATQFATLGALATHVPEGGTTP